MLNEAFQRQFHTINLPLKDKKSWDSERQLTRVIKGLEMAELELKPKSVSCQCYHCDQGARAFGVFKKIKFLEYLTTTDTQRLKPIFKAKSKHICYTQRCLWYSEEQTLNLPGPSPRCRAGTENDLGPERSPLRMSHSLAVSCLRHKALWVSEQI